MEIKTVINNSRRDFGTTLALTGVIPLLAFAYTLTSNSGSPRSLTGETGYIMLATMGVFLSGMVVGRRMLWSLFNDLVEKNRLAAITETALTLGHEINNPLLIIRGNLEMVESELKHPGIDPKIASRLTTINDNCQRIGNVMEKMAKLAKPSVSIIHGNTKMIDLPKSE